MSAGGAAATEAALREDGLVVIIRAPTREIAHSCAGAAHDGGVRCIEITFGVPDCLELVAELCAAWPQAVIGVGTTMSPDQVHAAAAAGARFAVSPHLDPLVVRATRDVGLVSIPGASTPTEIVTAHRAGATLVKVFPSKTLGGPEYIRLMRGPLPDIPLVATGGISLSSVAAYLEAGVAAVGATADLFIPDLIESGEYGKIANRAKRFREAAKSAPRG